MTAIEDTAKILGAAAGGAAAAIAALLRSNWGRRQNGNGGGRTAPLYVRLSAEDATRVQRIESAIASMAEAQRDLMLAMREHSRQTTEALGHLSEAIGAVRIAQAEMSGRLVRNS